MPHGYRKLTEQELKDEEIYRSQLRIMHAEWTKDLREEGLID